LNPGLLYFLELIAMMCLKRMGCLDGEPSNTLPSQLV